MYNVVEPSGLHTRRVEFNDSAINTLFITNSYVGLFRFFRSSENVSDAVFTIGTTPYSIPFTGQVGQIKIEITRTDSSPAWIEIEGFATGGLTTDVVSAKPTAAGKYYLLPLENRATGIIDKIDVFDFSLYNESSPQDALIQTISIPPALVPSLLYSYRALCYVESNNSIYAVNAYAAIRISLDEDATFLRMYNPSTGVENSAALIINNSSGHWFAPIYLGSLNAIAFINTAGYGAIYKVDTWSPLHEGQSTSLYNSGLNALQSCYVDTNKCIYSPSRTNLSTPSSSGLRKDAWGSSQQVMYDKFFNRIISVWNAQNGMYDLDYNYLGVYPHGSDVSVRPMPHAFGPVYTVSCLETTFNVRLVNNETLTNIGSFTLDVANRDATATVCYDLQYNEEYDIVAMLTTASGGVTKIPLMKPSNYDGINPNSIEIPCIEISDPTNYKVNPYFKHNAHCFNVKRF